MKLSVAVVTEISRRVAHQYDPTLEVIGVVLTEGASDRAEVVVRVRGCHPPEPCRVVLNVDRHLTREQLATQVGVELRTAIESHRSKSVD
jgi:hypothetical protein